MNYSEHMNPKLAMLSVDIACLIMVLPVPPSRGCPETGGVGRGGSHFGSEGGLR